MILILIIFAFTAQFDLLKGGEFKVDKLINYAHMALSSEPEKLKNVKEVAASCKDATKDKDRCEKSNAIFRCMKENSKLKSVIEYFLKWE